MKIIIFSILFSALLVCGKVNFRGLHPDLAAKFATRTSFPCRDKSQTVAIEKLNDNYCDCWDGSDEPGTSACGNSFFYCANAGYKAKFIGSLFVDDGVCDCCDGSDEPVNNCPDTCEAEGASWRAEIQQQKEDFESGIKVRLEYIETASKELEELKLEKIEKQKQLDEAIEFEKNAITVKDTWAIREKLAQKLLDERNKETEKEQTNDEEIHEPDDSLEEDEDDVIEEVEDGDIVEISEDDAPAEEKKDEEKLYDEMFENGPKDDATLQNYIDVAKEKQTEANEASEAKRKLEERINEIDSTLSTDYGADHAYYALRGQCFHFDTPEYRYKLCPFKSVTQGPAGGGGGGTDMGQWSKWMDTNHQEMMYENGAQCWQGPKRSCKVRLQCGRENILSDVQEPNKCEYTMLFKTPAACTPAQLEKLQNELSKSVESDVFAHHRNEEVNRDEKLHAAAVHDEL